VESFVLTSLRLVSKQSKTTNMPPSLAEAQATVRLLGSDLTLVEVGHGNDDLFVRISVDEMVLTRVGQHEMILPRLSVCPDLCTRSVPCFVLMTLCVPAPLRRRGLARSVVAACLRRATERNEVCAVGPVTSEDMAILLKNGPWQSRIVAPAMFIIKARDLGSQEHIELAS
jgi:hypothetical protein